MNEDINELVTVILSTHDSDAKFRASVQMLKLIFDTQKKFLIAIRAVVKDRDSLDEKQVEAIRTSVESLIGGANQIQGFFDVILNKEYKVN